MLPPLPTRFRRLLLPLLLLLLLLLIPGLFTAEEGVEWLEFIELGFDWPPRGLAPLWKRWPS